MARHGARGERSRCPYIISWRGHGVSEVETAWKSACRRAGVPDLLVHDLRRTAARTMIRAGIPEKQIMLIAGCKTRGMFDRYHIVDERDIQEAGKKLARHLAQQECLVKEGTVEWSSEVSQIEQVESIQ